MGFTGGGNHTTFSAFIQIHPFFLHYLDDLHLCGCDIQLFLDRYKERINRFLALLITE